MTTPTLRYPLGGRTAWLVWTIGVLAYLVAVFHRFSLGVAGIEAAQRFGISAALLSVFSLVQLAVYAGMQIPAGVLLDHFGSKRLLITGGILMSAGQLLFAFVTSFGLAILARVLIGFGDALTFISVLKLVAHWFPARRNPVILQLTGQLGQFGAVVSAVPLIAALHGWGWERTFVAAAAIGAAVSLAVLVLLRDSPYAATPDERPRVTNNQVRESLRLAWAEPGTKLGLWTHFVTVFPATAFGLLWGYPFLVTGQGVSPGTAGVLISTMIISGIVAGPFLGHLVGRFPFHRSKLVLGIVAVSALTWTVVLAWPGRAPMPLLVVLVLSMAANGPGSMIAFDYARTFNPVQRIGSASGIANVGGFTASLIVIVLIGIIVDVLTPGSSTEYSTSTFRWAFAVQYPMWAIGVFQVLRYRRQARAQLAARDPAGYLSMRAGRPEFLHSPE